MSSEGECRFATNRELVENENQVREKTDENGNRWYRAYTGSGAHFESWLAQCKELGEVMIEEIKPDGYICIEGQDEKLFRIWVKYKDPDK